METRHIIISCGDKSAKRYCELLNQYLKADDLSDDLEEEIEHNGNQFIKKYAQNYLDAKREQKEKEERKQKKASKQLEQRMAELEEKLNAQTERAENYKTKYNDNKANLEKMEERLNRYESLKSYF